MKSYFFLVRNLDLRGTIDTKRSRTILPQGMCNKMFLRVPQSKPLARSCLERSRLRSTRCARNCGVGQNFVQARINL